MSPPPPPPSPSGGAPPRAVPVTVPVLLLKTRAAAGDAYQDALAASSSHGCRFEPRFVPVLSHRLDDGGTCRLRGLLQQRRFGGGQDCAFGGLIFTSQRAVEAFAAVVADGARDAAARDAGWPHLQGVPLYSVGPATARALDAVPQAPPLHIVGQESGNGEALARFIVDHYPRRPRRRPLLFLVGEQRSDIVSRTLMDAALPADDRIQVDEMVVYRTGVMQSFPRDFAAALRQTDAAPTRWVVVFSPAGCEAMLGGLGLLDGELHQGRRDGKTFILTIGATTRAHLHDAFGFEPDACAKTPSPQGVLQAIADFEASRSKPGQGELAARRPRSPGPLGD